MFNDSETETFWIISKKVRREYPSTYCNLMGSQRMAVLRLLDEPIQSTLHQIIQQNVAPGTKCLYKGCHGNLDRTGKCSKDCCQLGINIVDDIMYCQNCDRYGFPCPACYVSVFHKQLHTQIDDY